MHAPWLRSGGQVSLCFLGLSQHQPYFSLGGMAQPSSELLVVGTPPLSFCSLALAAMLHRVASKYHPYLGICICSLSSFHLSALCVNLLLIDIPSVVSGCFGFGAELCQTQLLKKEPMSFLPALFFPLSSGWDGMQ